MGNSWMVNVLREAGRQGRLHELCYCVVVNFPGWLSLGEPEQIWEEYPGFALVYPVDPDPKGALAGCLVYCVELSISYRGLGLVFRPFLQGFDDAWRHRLEFIWEGIEIDFIDESNGEVSKQQYIRH